MPRSPRFADPARISVPWTVVLVLAVLLIWGDSCVPGEGSGELSLAVLDWARGLLDAVGLPSAWLTNFLVRKAAHFSEYACLGALAQLAFRPAHARSVSRWAAVAAVLVAVPCADETIQLFVPGRSGMVTDVLIDLAGAFVGTAIAWAFAARSARREGFPADSRSFSADVKKSED